MAPPFSFEGSLMSEMQETTCARCGKKVYVVRDQGGSTHLVAQVKVTFATTYGELIDGYPLHKYKCKAPANLPEPINTAPRRTGKLGQIKLRFGRFKDKTLDEIDVLELDKLLGWDALHDNTRQQITAYLKLPNVAEELKRAIEAKS